MGLIKELIMNDLNQFKKNLEKKLKDRQLANATFNFYNRTVEEMAMVIFFKNVSEESASNSDLVYKHSFLFSNHTFMEHYFDELKNKVIELEFFTCFKEALTSHIDKIIEEHELNEEEIEKIKDAKFELFDVFNKRQEVLKKEYTFLKMKKNKPLIWFIEMCMCAFFIFSAALSIDNGSFPFFLSLSSLLAIHFSLTKATGQQFENVKFRRRLNQIFPSKLQKGINAVSILYLSALSLGMISLFFVLASFFVNQGDSFVLTEYPSLSLIVLFLLQLLTTIWFFFDGVYEKRYFLFKRFELKHTFEEKETFLEYVRPSKKIEKI